MSVASSCSPLNRRLWLAVGLLAATAAMANERPFTLSYTAHTMPQGSREYEQWVTWGTRPAENRSYDRFDIRHEIEYGVTDRLRLSLYYDWRYQNGTDGEDRGAHFQDVAIESFYQLTHPVTDPIGSALYFETKVGRHLVELEGKLILSKDLGPWTLAWNGYLEAEWEGDNYAEDNGELGQTAGVSYEVHPRLRIGLEGLHEVARAGWSAWGDHVAWAGPNVSYRTASWWLTLTPTVQLTSVADEPDYLTRLIFGIDF